MLDVQSDSNPDSIVNDPSTVDAASPELNLLPLGSDRNTWPNIVRNKKNVIFCETQFQYLGNRMRCIKDFTKGPLLD
eukprot:CAMPEP_0181293606 /NCGR_PEP_ID=MMETSP1101-20121128/3154_1 /TAXON_ID=46948 /ORGANISM="Rhodomonas abbreviata, Strain Caron Lab Isolate" /LENGTH=76 /DNA_ID=CAMNT_0023398203 /DNA_START=154 /DNA_END=384 /DNA_ORIENTATION=-